LLLKPHTHPVSRIFLLLRQAHIYQKHMGMCHTAGQRRCGRERSLWDCNQRADAPYRKVSRTSRGQENNMTTNTTEPTGSAPGTRMIHTEICCTGELRTITGREINQERSAAAVQTDEQTTGSSGGERKAPDQHGGAG
jgi:hypothetical protein